MTELRCDKDIFIRELKANKAVIDEQDWNSFFAAVENNIVHEQYSKVIYLVADYIKLFKEEGFDVAPELAQIYSYTFKDDVLDDVDLRNAEIIHAKGITKCQGSILLSKKIKLIAYRAFTLCDPFTIKFDGTKEEWDRVAKDEDWHSWPITIECTDQQWEEWKAE